MNAAFKMPAALVLSLADSIAGKHPDSILAPIGSVRLWSLTIGKRDFIRYMHPRKHHFTGRSYQCRIDDNTGGGKTTYPTVHQFEAALSRAVKAQVIATRAPSPPSTPSPLAWLAH